jgi:pimeloyl-ACP methyl ester carboxylesterase
MKTIKRNNAIIDYHLSGEGDITLVFVHGSYIDKTYWNAQVEYFNKQFKVLTIDLPGHGKSGRERSEWSLKSFADDVNEVIKELKLQNVILIGHSMGAGINLIAAVRYPKPIIGFVAVDFFKDAAAPIREKYHEQVDAILENLKTNFDNTNEEYARTALLRDETPSTVTQRVIRDFRNACKPMGLATTPEIFSMDKIESEYLPKLPVKLYLLNVDYIPTNEAPLQHLLAHGYDIEHLDGTSHFPMIENPDAFNAALEKAINKIEIDVHVH